MVHLEHIHLWAVVVDIYHLSQSDFGVKRILRHQCGKVHKCEKH